MWWKHTLWVQAKAVHKHQVQKWLNRNKTSVGPEETTNLLASGQVRAAGARSPVLAFSEPRLGGAEEGGAPWAHGTAVVPGRWDEGRMKTDLEVPLESCGIRWNQVSDAPGLYFAWFDDWSLLLQTVRYFRPLTPVGGLESYCLKAQKSPQHHITVSRTKRRQAAALYHLVSLWSLPL